MLLWPLGNPAWFREGPFIMASFAELGDDVYGRLISLLDRSALLAARRTNIIMRLLVDTRLQAATCDELATLARCGDTSQAACATTADD